MNKQEGSLVSIILPMYNAESWLEECLNSVLQQTYQGPMELCVYNDASCDSSLKILEKLRPDFSKRNITIEIKGHSGEPKGVGYAKNQAISISNGIYLCFLDSDDVMHSERVERQLEVCQLNQTAIIGSRFHREPENSTERFTQWANSLTPDQLHTQAFTSHGPTVIMPTWFCHRKVYDSVGGFDEGGKGVPEDLIFFYSHLSHGGSLTRVDQDLLMYRFHPQCQTFSVKEETIWKWRVDYLEQQILKDWSHFSIWNAGKQGRKLYRSLSKENQNKVSMFCDVDEKKILKQFYIYEESKDRPKPKVPIVHFTQVIPPVIICIKMNLSGNFEQNLASLRLKEGRDYIHFN